MARWDDGQPELSGYDLAALLMAGAYADIVIILMDDTDGADETTQVPDYVPGDWSI